jgi:hypothetical protein
VNDLQKTRFLILNRSQLGRPYLSLPVPRIHLLVARTTVLGNSTLAESPSAISGSADADRFCSYGSVINGAALDTTNANITYLSKQAAEFGFAEWSAK